VIQKRTAGWWHLWLLRRRIDDYRMWAGRGQAKRTFYSISAPHRTAASEQASRDLPTRSGPESDFLPDTLKTPSFEETTVAIMDLESAWKLLKPRQQRLLLLKATGLSRPELAERFTCSLDTVSTMLYQARQQLRAACA